MWTFTYDGTTPRIYKNGSEVSYDTQATGTLVYYTNNHAPYMGSDGTTRYFDGKLDEGSLWSRVLSPAEITNLYNSGSGYQIPSEVDSTLSLGQVGYWTFDSDATDATVNGYDGTVDGATNTTGKINNGYSFDGTNDKINIPAIGYTLDDFSVNFWFNSDDISQTKVMWSRSADNNFTIYNTSSTNIQVRLIGTNRAFTVPTMSSSTWYMLTVTRQSDTVRVYLNGTESSSEGQTSAGVMPNEIFYIGQYNSGFNWDGLIDEVGMWNRALSSTEVTALYNSGSGFQYPYSGATPSGWTGTINGVTNPASIKS